MVLEYSVLGAEHIWGGIDHLLFVFGLLLLVGGGSRLLWTITAFTVGHSITLSLVTLGFFEYPVALVECRRGQNVRSSGYRLPLSVRPAQH